MPRLGFRRAGLLAVILLPALSLFYIRGPRRALTDSSDFATVYAASRCWMHHVNPYLHSNIVRLYELGHGDQQQTPNWFNGTSVYPPSTFPIVAAVARLDWKQAKRLWLALLLISFAASLACIWRSEILPNATVKSAVIALFLMFSAVHSGIAKGQPSVLCISLLICAFYLPRSRRMDLLSGILLGVSCCVKPNIGLPYLLFFCWRRQWRIVASSIAVVLPVSIAALITLHAFSPGWLPFWLGNLKTATSPGNVNDPTISGPMSFMLVNFQTVIGFFTTNLALCNVVTYALCGGLVIWAVKIADAQGDPWLPLAFLTLLVLLGSYHRYYDVQLLMLCTNAVAEISRTQWRRYLWMTLVIPGALLWFSLHSIALNELARFGLTLPTPSSHSAWQFLLFRNEPICLGLLAAVFALAILKKSRLEALAESESKAASLLETVR
jgi:hypothetical protein